MNITKRPWGSLNGAPVYLFDLESPQGMRVVVSNYGGIIQSLVVPDKNGNPLDVVLGYDTLEEYLRGEHYFGAIVGPVADRIENGRCTVEERRVPWDAEATIAQVIKSDQYRCARVWSELVIAAWRTCREKVASFLRFCEEYARTIGDERRPFATSTWEAALPLWQQSLPHDHPELFV
jgi:hypothetical protein